MSKPDGNKVITRGSRQTNIKDFFLKENPQVKKTCPTSATGSSTKSPRSTENVKTPNKSQGAKAKPVPRKEPLNIEIFGREKTSLSEKKEGKGKQLIGKAKEKGKKEEKSDQASTEKNQGKTFEKPSHGKSLDKERKGKENPSEVDKKPNLKRKAKAAGMFSWGYGADRDTEEYRNGYPGKDDHPNWDDNYRFYMNQIPSKPDGDYIDQIHVNWWGDYKLLEVHHGYIQWLFPIRESGLNWHAQELQLHEIEKLQKSRKAMKRILTSYKMMLDFYGMKLADEKDGTIERADNWPERSSHLNRSFHNYLRITRILKCLGEFGYEDLKKNFIKFVLHEGLVEGTLTNVIESCFKYWIGVLKNEEERREMYEYYYELMESENCALKRRCRSPSPSYRSRWSNDYDKEKKNNGSDSENEMKEVEDVSKFREFEKEFPNDSEDETLYYAMSLIDDDKDAKENESKMDDRSTRKKKKDHEMSDSEVEEEKETEEEYPGGSQEMTYWNNEAKKTKEAEFEAGSESCDVAEGDKGIEELVDSKLVKKEDMIEKTDSVNDVAEKSKESGTQEHKTVTSNEVKEPTNDIKSNENEPREEVEMNEGNSKDRSSVSDNLSTNRDDVNMDEKTVPESGLDLNSDAKEQNKIITEEIPEVDCERQIDVAEKKIDDLNMADESNKSETKNIEKDDEQICAVNVETNIAKPIAEKEDTFANGQTTNTPNSDMKMEIDIHENMDTNEISQAEIGTVKQETEKMEVS